MARLAKIDADYAELSKQLESMNQLRHRDLLFYFSKTLSFGNLKLDDLKFW